MNKDYISTEDEGNTDSKNGLHLLIRNHEEAIGCIKMFEDSDQKGVMINFCGIRNTFFVNNNEITEEKIKDIVEAIMDDSFEQMWFECTSPAIGNNSQPMLSTIFKDKKKVKTNCKTVGFSDNNNPSITRKDVYCIAIGHPEYGELISIDFTDYEDLTEINSSDSNDEDEPETSTDDE